VSSSFIQLFGVGDDDAEDEEVEEERPRLPTWFGPPDDELGVAVQLGVVVGRSGSGAVALRHATVYSNGVQLAVIAVARGVTNAQSSRLLHAQHRFEENGEPSAEFLRIGLELPGGERVSNLGGRTGRRWPKPDEEPKGPVFFEQGGGGGSGGGRHTSLRPAFWLWPLPEPGTIRVSCEWPAVEIPLSTVEIDAGDLTAAAERAVPLWSAPLA
jgi:hypothetical protein